MLLPCCPPPSYSHDNHVHPFTSVTSSDHQHSHKFDGRTGTVIPLRNSHIHFYGIFTQVARDHKHYLCGWTGPAIHLKDGTHIHYFCGKTTMDFDHLHMYGDYTGKEL